MGSPLSAQLFAVGQSSGTGPSKRKDAFQYPTEI